MLEFPAAREPVSLHNQGYDLLKTPYPPGTSARNWEGAAQTLEAALKIHPNQAITHHLLGLVFEGMKRDEQAVMEWFEVLKLDPNFNFESRAKAEIV